MLTEQRLCTVQGVAINTSVLKTLLKAEMHLDMLFTHNVGDEKDPDVKIVVNNNEYNGKAEWLKELHTLIKDIVEEI